MPVIYSKNTRSGLAYIKFGNGSIPLLCFHGYALDKDYFRIFENTLDDYFTFYSFDLFFHGESIWMNGDKPIEKQEFIELINDFLIIENIGRFSIISFSMGGKPALMLLEFFSERINRMVLAAPDGLEINNWYYLATGPFRHVFKAIIFRPGIIFFLMNIFAKFNLSDPKVIKFAANEMNTLEKRKRVYYSWMVFSKFRFDIAKLIEQINRFSIHISFVTGRYDKVITTQTVSKYERRIKNVQHLILDSNHGNLLKLLAEEARLFQIFGIDNLKPDSHLKADLN